MSLSLKKGDRVRIVQRDFIEPWLYDSTGEFFGYDPERPNIAYIIFTDNLNSQSGPKLDGQRGPLFPIELDCLAPDTEHELH